MPAGVAPIAALNAAPNDPAAMAARRAVLGRKKAGTRARRAHPTVAESAVVGIAAADAAAMPAGWTPSRFFGAWKKEVAKTAGFDLVWSDMGHYAGFTPESLEEAVDSVLRTTIASKAYDSDDFYEGVLASHNDYDAMQAYAAAFVDAFWRDFWTEYREKYPAPGTTAAGQGLAPYIDT